MIMLYAGLRKGELIALTWSDVDLEAGTVTVNKAVEYDNDVPRLKTPKSNAGNRTVYIPDILIGYLRRMPKNGPLVFPNQKGEMFRLKQFQRAWDTYLLDLDMLYGNVPERKSKYDPHFKGVVGIRRFTPHMLRHTFCTMLYEAGIDIVTAKDQMGHADVKTTLSIYTHLSESHAKEEMQKLNTKPV